MTSTEDRSRKPLRWEGFDYRTATTYFVTISTTDRRPLFGRVDENGRPHPSPIGLLVTETWLDLVERFPVELIAFVAMPDHVDGLLTIVPDKELAVETPSLGRVIGAFKSGAWRRTRSHLGEPAQLWQRGYHDRVVRSDDECRQFEWYIAENPARWAAARMPGA